jgi:nucleoside-diphosphate-sugar epimerase
MRNLSHDGHTVHAIHWKEACKWLSSVSADEILNRLSSLSENGLDILFANGQTDPSLPLSTLIESNFLFPQRVISVSRRLPNFRFITFGTAMECFDSMAVENNYVSSKRQLCEWMGGLECAEFSDRILHIRLHTLYGGTEPKHYMFLGQLVAALRAKSIFSMSSGYQLREYHHVDDIAISIIRLLEHAWSDDPILTISSGHPVRLLDLAKAIFSSLGDETALRIGALPMAESENTAQHFEPSPKWLLQTTRPPIEGVCSWVGELVKRSDRVSL